MRNHHLLILCLCVPVLLCSCSREKPHPSAPVPKYDVMLISIDTLRADYLKLYDPRGVETPHLGEMARDSVLFRHAVSQIPYTLPSHCTLLTGLYPVGHGVKDNVHDQLPGAIPTLAELFKMQNYQTAGFVGSMVLGRKTGLGRGFDFYDDFFSRADVKAGDLGGVERRARDVLASFEHWYDNNRSPGNAFMFVHFYDPHSPYQPPPGYAASGSQQDLYRGEIRYVDDVLGDLFSLLKKKNAWNRTIVLVTSDHGEMLQEHGELGHGFFLYQPALSVPLLLHLPGVDGARTVEDPVQLVDVAPTLLQAAGSTPPAGMQGESLLSLVRNGERKKNRLAFSESYFAALQMGVSPIFSVQDGSYKYIDSPKPELYNLQADPAEAQNLAMDRKSEVRQFQTRVEQYQKAYFKAGVAAQTRAVSSEEAEQFAALGYLGGRISETSWDRKKDPKDYIGEWNKSLEASYLIEHGQYSRALPLIQDIRRSGSLPAESVTLLEAQSYEGMGDVERAESILNSAAASPGAVNELASLYARTRRPEKANAAYARVLQEDFSYFALYDYVLFLKQAGKTQEASALVKQAQDRKDADLGRPFFAEMWIVLGDLPAAEKILGSLLNERPWESKWYVELASVYQSQGQAPKALALMEAQYVRFSTDAEYLLRLGILYNASGQKNKEMETFQQLMRAYPSDPRGYFYLAKAMLDTGQPPGAVVDLALRGLSLNPLPEMQIFGHYLLGNAYQATGKPAESRKEFEIAQNMEKKLQLQ